MHEKRLDNGARLISFPEGSNGGRRIVRANNFSVEWINPDLEKTFESREETVALFVGSGAIMGAGGRAEVGPYSVAVVPAGAYEIQTGSGAAIILATDRSDLPALPYQPNTRVAPLGTPFRRVAPLATPSVRAIADIPFPPGNPRLKFLQSATMSINLVVYDGARNRAALSPHAHADIEQGTLTIEGEFVHHLRTPWGPNADMWRDDIHEPAGPGELVLIPPELIHTTEGVNGGRHFLVDIYAPPRRDFLAKGWVTNAGDYERA